MFIKVFISHFYLKITNNSAIAELAWLAGLYKMTLYRKYHIIY